MKRNWIKKSKLVNVFLIAVFVFVSVNTGLAAEKRMKAEQMVLTNYQVEKSGNTSFINMAFRERLLVCKRRVVGSLIANS